MAWLLFRQCCYPDSSPVRTALLFGRQNPWWDTLRCAVWGSGTDLAGYVSSGIFSLSLRGPSHQALTLFGGVRLIAWRLRHPSLWECRRGPRHFWECQACLGSGLALGPTLKRPCAILIRSVDGLTNTATTMASKMVVQLVCPTNAWNSWRGSFRDSPLPPQNN